MEPVVGSVLHFTPATPGWVANLTDDEGSAWQEPIVGWGCVVVWTAYAAENEDVDTKGTKQFQTEVQAITLLEDGTIEPLVMRDGITLAGLVMPGMVLVPSRSGE